MPTLTWYPPLLMQRKFVELMFDDDMTPPGHEGQTRHLIEKFKRECMSVESRLSSAIKLERLRGRKVRSEEGRESAHDEFLGWLQAVCPGSQARGQPAPATSPTPSPTPPAPPG